nr:NAD(P)H-dependent oxidoreductase subunit E [Bacteroidota bacterium]
MHNIDEIIKQYRDNQRQYLIPILQDIQQSAGFLSEEAIVQVGNHLHIPTGKIYAVATFYNQFRFKPSARYLIKVCHGTTCHMKACEAVINEFEKQLNIRMGEPAGSKLFSLETTSCLGACGNGPVVKINDTFYSDVTPQRVVEITNHIKKCEGI